MSEHTEIIAVTADSPWGILSSEVAERIRTQPACHLLWAIMENAFHEYMMYTNATSRRGQRLFREAEDWIMQDTSTWLCSFMSISHTLGLDPDYLRTGLKRWRAQQSAPAAFKHAA